MPRIDVTKVLRSPYFRETFTVERRPETIGNNGRSVVTPTDMTVQGVVNPTTPKQDLTGQKRTAKRAIRAHTQTRLYDSVQGFQPDVVIWQGNRYEVMDANPWSNYGTGFFDVYAEIEDTVTSL